MQNNFRGTGQPVLVPGDMGTGSWIMAGPKTGQNQAFGSSCHGAGKGPIKNQTKQMIDGKALKQKTKNSGLEFMLQLQMFCLKKPQMLTKMSMKSLS